MATSAPSVVAAPYAYGAPPFAVFCFTHGIDGADKRAFAAFISTRYGVSADTVNMSQTELMGDWCLFQQVPRVTT